MSEKVLLERQDGTLFSFILALPVALGALGLALVVAILLLPVMILGALYQAAYYLTNK